MSRFKSPSRVLLFGNPDIEPVSCKDRIGTQP